MNFLKTNKLLSHLFFIAFFCIGTVCFAENSANHFVTSKIQTEKAKVNKSQFVSSIELIKSNQEPYYIEFEDDNIEDDNIEDDDYNDTFSSLSKNIVSKSYLSSLNNTSTTKSTFSSIPLYILFGSLKIPSIF